MDKIRNAVWFKILTTILLLIVLGVLGLIVTFIVSWGTAKFTNVTILSFIVLIVYVITIIWGNGRRLTTLLGLYFLGVVLFVGGNLIYDAYIDSIPVVKDQDVNLSDYAPFVEGTKAVKLTEPSTFKIPPGSTLPILDGATALYPLYSAFVQATYPPELSKWSDFSLVMCSKTAGAFQNLIDGKVDIIFVARPSEQQIIDAEMKGVEFQMTPVGHEAFVFFVNSRNKVEGLTSDQIRDIYSGKITNWKEVGGANEPIKAFQREEGSGSQTMLNTLMEGRALISPPTEDIQGSMGGIIERTADYRNHNNAIGYSFRFFSTEMVKNNQIRLLKIDGVYPDPGTIASREYPFVADFYAVTTNTKNPHVQPFIQWMLSSQGQYLVEKTGYTPL